MPRMFLKHRFTKDVFCLTLLSLQMFLSSTDLPLVLNILNLVLVLDTRLLQIAEAFGRLADLFFFGCNTSSVPPVVLTMLPR